jgi:glycosyltransferase involved in cell wall biosynthesis
MDKISIIIPVYNVEPYIRQCLDSALNQSYTNLEIICVDDGSTDNSGKICDEYVKKDNRIKVFHKINGGVSSARNLGLKNLTGQYVGFLDPDDWIEPNMYEILHKIIKDNNVKLSVVNFFKDKEEHSTAMINRKVIPYGVIYPEDMLLYHLNRDNYMGFGSSACNKLFDAKVILDNDLKFDEKIRYGEDLLFYLSAVLIGDCIGGYLDIPLYHYRQRHTSITNSMVLKIKLEILSVYKQVEELFMAKGYSSIAYWVRGFYCYHASVAAEFAIKNNEKGTFVLMQNEIKLHLDDYIKTNEEFPEKFERMNNLISYKW